MKKIYKMSLRLKNTKTVLAEGFEPGELITQEVWFEGEPEKFDSVMFIKALMDAEAELIANNIEVIMEEIPEETK